MFNILDTSYTTVLLILNKTVDLFSTFPGYIDPKWIHMWIFFASMCIVFYAYLHSIAIKQEELEIVDNYDDYQVLTSLELRYIKKTITFIMQNLQFKDRNELNKYKTYQDRYNKFFKRFYSTRMTHTNTPKSESEKFLCDCCYKPIYNNQWACNNCSENWLSMAKIKENKNFRCKVCEEYIGIGDFCPKCKNLDYNKILTML
jgi:hypothetical protein